jgi:hypothetical protein
VADFFISTWTFPLSPPSWADTYEGANDYKVNVLWRAEDSYAIWVHPDGIEVVTGLSKEDAFSHARVLARRLNRIIPNMPTESELRGTFRDHVWKYGHDEFMLPLPDVSGTLVSSSSWGSIANQGSHSLKVNVGSPPAFSTMKGGGLTHWRSYSTNPPMGAQRDDMWTQTDTQMTFRFDGQQWV